MRRPVIFGTDVGAMATTIRPVVSSSKISKHRYYELKHFCLQYHEWRGDPKGYRSLIRETCDLADPAIGRYIFLAVTENLSYTYLKTKLGIPCGRSMFFDRYRKFFRLLNDVR